MAAIIVLNGSEWNWICGTPIRIANTSVEETDTTAWEHVRADSCFANFLLLIAHVLFLVLFTLIIAIVLLRKKFKRRSSSSSRPILIRYPGHVQRWITNVLYLVVVLVSLGEGVLSDNKLQGPTQPHLYLPQVFALLTGLMSTSYYNVMEARKKPRMVYGLLAYWLLVSACEAYRMTVWVQSTKIDSTVLRFDAMVLVLFSYAMYICLEIVVIAKKDCVSMLSASTFWWFNWVFKLGYKRPLEMEDLGCLPKMFTSKFNRQRFNKAMKQEKARAERHKTKLSLYRVFFRLCSKPIFYAGVLRFLADTLGFVGPMAINALVNYATSLQSKDPNFYPDTYSDYVTVMEFIQNGFALIFIIFVSSFLRFVFLQNHYHIVIVQGLHVKAAIQSAVYDKSLSLASWTLSSGEMTVGAIINHMSTDPENLANMIEYTHYVWAIPYQVGGTLLLLYYNLSTAALAGFSIFGLLIPLQFCMASVLSKVEKNILSLSDKRLKRTNEILQGIKMVKVQALEDVFFNYINVIRRKEIQQMIKAAIFVGLLYFTQNACPVVVSLLSFTLYSVLTGNVLTPNIAFSTLALINQIALPITIIPMVVSFFVSGHISTQRLGKLFIAKEIDPEDSGRRLKDSGDDNDDDINNLTSVDENQSTVEAISEFSVLQGKHQKGSRISYQTFTDDAEEESILPNLSPELIVKISSGDYTWDPSASVPILRDISVQIPTGKLTMIVGKVGSGKSSLLSAFLGEMTRNSGTIMWNNRLSPKVAYCPQKAWLLNRSLEKNVTFHQEKDEARYHEVVDSCALQPDIDILPDGDQSMIGEKGINLSGGQKQRVSMARAIYNNSEVVIMDDPLSALDVHVGRHVFHEAIMGRLVKEGRTVILVSHQLQYLQYADKVIVMKSGAITCQGTPEEVMESDPELAETWKQAVEHIEDAAKSGTETEEEVEDVEEERRHLATLCKVNPKIQHAKDDKKEQNAGALGRISWKEERELGDVSYEVYLWYARMMKWPLVIISSVAMLIQSGLSIGTNFWLSEWSSAGLNSTNTSDPEVEDLTQYYIIGYTGLALSSVFMSLISAIVINISTLVASRRMHEDMLENVLHLPMKFYDNTPIGRIVNRFSSDMWTVDKQLGQTLMWCFVAFLNCMSAILVNAVVTPIFLVFVLPVIIAFFILQQYFIKTTLELKRIDSIAKSPIYALFGETLNGLPTVRSYRCQSKFRKELFERIDNSVLTYLYLQTANRWLGIRLDLLGAVFVLVAGLTALTVASIGDLDPGYVGLAVTYALSSSMWLNWLVRNSSDREIQMNATERIRWFIKAEREVYEGSIEPSSSWPTEGGVSYDNIDVRYASELPLILKDINVKFTAHEKVGIVGRTGSGKTSLVNLLFRLVEQCKGSVSIDGLQINQIALKRLRSELAIIPQDPVLFSGNIRFNLDPRSKKSDDEIWKALEMAQIKEFLSKSEHGLDFEVSEGGENLSVGQRQLMCLARAFLQDTRVVVMDEATSSIDLQTDGILQKAVHTIFNDKTVLTIAHRVSTVKDYDKILVLANGEIQEYDTPHNLINNPDSVFSQMLKAGK